jgi:uncharacterized coiled-coil protein SlyX
MKKTILTATIALLAFSCNNDKTAEINSENRERDSLVAEIEQRDSSFNQLLTSFTDVERNLDSVAAHQHVIYQTTNNFRGDLKSNQKEHINSQISAINDLMDANRAKIDELNKKLKRSGRKNYQLEKVIATLNDQLAQKDAELSSLNEQLAALHTEMAQLRTSMDTLNKQNLAQSETISSKTAELHTAYYIVGGSKDLAEAKLIDKKGGLLGIGKTLKINENADNSKFTKIDYTKTNTIDVFGDHVKIVTSHPSDSYTLETDEKDKKMVRNLVINDPEKFWSMSKYLIVVKN